VRENEMDGRGMRKGKVLRVGERKGGGGNGKEGNERD